MLALYTIITFVGSVYLSSTDRGWILFLVFPLIVLGSIIISMIDSLKYNRLFLMGRIDEAFEEISKKERKYRNNHRATNRLQAVKATLFTNLGQYEKSDFILNQMSGKLDKNLEGMRIGLLAFNKLMNGGDLIAAREELKQAMTIIDLSSNILILANVELELGNRELAAQALDTYQHRNDKKRLYSNLSRKLIQSM